MDIASAVVHAAPGRADEVRAQLAALRGVEIHAETPERFQAKRIKLAENEWTRMRRNDSQECRNCHNYEYMDLSEQGRRAVATHSKAFPEGKTCIDCHKGIAHQLPPIEQEIGAPKTAEAAAKK